MRECSISELKVTIRQMIKKVRKDDLTIQTESKYIIKLERETTIDIDRLMMEAICDKQKKKELSETSTYQTTHQETNASVVKIKNRYFKATVNLTTLTLSSLAIAASLTVGGLGALTVKQAMDSNDFTTGQKQEIFKAADLPQSQLPPELSPIPKPRPDRLLDYKPLTNTTAEQTLLKVAQSSGLKGVELAAFMAQMAHESENFSDMVEDHPNIKKYAGKLAKALGNKSVNDAERFIGRGYIQLTGRWNYEWMQKSLGIDLTSSWSDAHKASNPDIAAKIAVEFWKQRVRPKVNDFSNTAEVTKPINSRLHGLEHRETRFAKLAKGLVVRR